MNIDILDIFDLSVLSIWGGSGLPSRACEYGFVLCWQVLADRKTKSPVV
ncbi:hypothetical protein [Alcaligenes faecalis]|nr:hypothetical protein [Alcaligenes faecalis]